MKASSMAGCFLLLCLSGCKHVPDPQPAAAAPPPETARSIVIGMSMDEVIKLRGRHFRVFLGPQLNDVALVYDDITVQLWGVWRDKQSGVVCLVAPTPADINMFMGKTPYEDAK